MGGTIHADTVVTSLIALVVLVAVFAALGKTVSPVPSQESGPAGRVIEFIVEFCEKIIHDFIGPNTAKYLWYVGSIFVFILTVNWFGLLPWFAWDQLAGEHLGESLKLGGALTYEAPTADINLTAALALLSLILYWVFGIAHGGVGGFLGHHWFAKPVALFPLRIMEDLTRPLSLALRLFANITAGHVVGLVLLFLVPWVIPTVMLPMELFVGAVQAFIFATLSASYIGAAVADHHEAH
jgi:F-type H+-transporting ATPase subunit a